MTIFNLILKPEDKLAHATRRRTRTIIKQKIFKPIQEEKYIHPCDRYKKKRNKSKISYRKLINEELGKDGKPKKSFRKSKKIVKQEAIDEMLEMYLNGEEVPFIVNASNHKFEYTYCKPEKPIVTSEDLNQYHIIEPECSPVPEIIKRPTEYFDPEIVRTILNKKKEQPIEPKYIPEIEFDTKEEELIYQMNGMNLDIDYDTDSTQIFSNPTSPNPIKIKGSFVYPSPYDDCLINDFENLNIYGHPNDSNNNNNQDDEILYSDEEINLNDTCF